MSAPFDHNRFIAVIMDLGSELTMAEFDAQASREEIARALCDDELQFSVSKIVEFNPSEGHCQDITEDVAKLIPAISAEAWRDDGRRVRAPAQSLMLRFGLEDPADNADRDPEGDAWQLGIDAAKDARIMAEVG